jgi:hypothetical protein
LKCRHNILDLHALPDDWAYLSMEVDKVDVPDEAPRDIPWRFSYRHYLCDAAMGGVEGAIYDSQHG